MLGSVCIRSLSGKMFPFSFGRWEKSSLTDDIHSPNSLRHCC